MRHFSRKIFGFREYLRCQLELLKGLPSLLSAMRSGRISKAFEEKLMLAVTAVNKCKYCTWVHVRAALKHGVGQKEIERIMEMAPGATADAYEAVGILYAQHYAESNRNPDREATEKLYGTYGKERANDILSYLRLIYFGNLMGNTFSAFLSRLKGNRVRGSHFFSELLIFLIGSPILVPLSILSGKGHRRT